MGYRIIGIFLSCFPIIFWGCGTKDVFPQYEKIACIGTSITDGYVLPVEQTYPYQLQNLVDSGDKVLNYGVGGTTLLKKGDSPYWSAEKYQFALQWKPTVVVIEFGTNDSKKQNWQYKSDFKSDYMAMIQSFRSLSSSPKVFICIPPPAFSKNFDVDSAVVRKEIIPLVYEIAKEANAPVIDLYDLMLPKSSEFIDGIHPTAAGAATIAKEVHKIISVE